MELNPNELMGSLFGIISNAGIIIIILVGAIALYFSGILKRRNYKVFLIEPRANDYQITVCPGDFEAGSKEFGVFFGAFKTIKTIAPPGKAIRPGNQILAFSKNRTDIHWITGDKFTVDDTQINAEPALDPGMKISTLSNMKKEIERHRTEEKWKEYLPQISFMIAAIIFLVAVVLVAQPIVAGMEKVSANLAAIDTDLKNMTVIKTVAQNTSTPQVNPMLPFKPLG